MFHKSPLKHLLFFFIVCFNLTLGRDVHTTNKQMNPGAFNLKPPISGIQFGSTLRSQTTSKLILMGMISAAFIAGPSLPSRALDIDMAMKGFGGAPSTERNGTEAVESASYSSDKELQGSKSLSEYLKQPRAQQADPMTHGYSK
jgi:hypothetical protein